MPDHPIDSPQDEGKFHSYTSHVIPWYVRVMWLLFWIGLIWYIIRFAIPSAKNYF